MYQLLRHQQLNCKWHISWTKSFYRKKWRIEQIDEQKFTQKMGILLGLSKN